MSLRPLSRFMCVAGLAAASMFGLPAPAMAAPTVTVSDECGYVLVRVENMTPEDISLLRNAEQVAPILGQPEPVEVTFELGASDGDVISAWTASGPDPPSHTYRAPAGCSVPSMGFFVVSNRCEGAFLVRGDNLGPEPVTDFLVTAGPDDEVLAELDLPVGRSAIVLPQPTTARVAYRVVRPTPGSERGLVIWRQTFLSPQSCEPAAVEADFTDECDQVTLDLRANAPDGQWAYLLTRNLGSTDPDRTESTELGTVDPGTERSHQIPARPGDALAVYLITGHPLEGRQPGPEVESLPEGLFLTLVEAHTHASPAQCAGETGGGAPEHGGGGELPVTGSRSQQLAAAGLALLAAGGLLVLAARRRATGSG